jgi:hypothetical protein
MFTLDEAKVLLDFLDRVTITGHQERENMSIVVNKIVQNNRPKPEEDPKAIAKREEDFKAHELLKLRQEEEYKLRNKEFTGPFTNMTEGTINFFQPQNNISSRNNSE